MRLSVVIVTYNSAGCIAECLEALKRALPNSEMIVVDNMSRDATLATATATDARVRVVRMSYNAGFGRACNEGVRIAEHDHVLLVNPDVVLVDATTDALESALAAPRLGLMAPELVVPHARGHTQAQLVARRSWLGELLRAAFGPFEPRELAGRARIARGREPAWAHAALLVVRRSEFLEVGGFDERFFLYYEDQQLGARYRDANLPIRGTTAIRATHNRGSSSALATSELIDRMAWCLLGWLEFVAMHHGPERARKSWLIVRRAHHAGQSVAALLARGSRTGRMGRKAEQLASLEHAVRDIARRAGHSPHEFCPVATRVVADAS